MEDNLEFKFLTIGDSGVGKTSLLNRYVEEQFRQDLAPTVGIDIQNKRLPYKSKQTDKIYDVRLQLWDTAGQERFRSLTSSFFRDAVGFILVFDLTNERSFLNVREWIDEVQKNASSDQNNMILIGNKCDLEQERIISRPRAIDFASQCKVEYIETSALKNTGISESIETLLNLVMVQFETKGNFKNQPNDSIKFFEDSRKRLPIDKEWSSKWNCCLYS